jgi:hypothetical protein
MGKQPIRQRDLVRFLGSTAVSWALGGSRAAAPSASGCHVNPIVDLSDLRHIQPASPRTGLYRRQKSHRWICSIRTRKQGAFLELRQSSWRGTWSENFPAPGIRPSAPSARGLAPADRERLMTLGADLERAWSSASVAPETRKRIVRTLLITESTAAREATTASKASSSAERASWSAPSMSARLVRATPSFSERRNKSRHGLELIGRWIVVSTPFKTEGARH